MQAHHVFSAPVLCHRLIETIIVLAGFTVRDRRQGVLVFPKVPSMTTPQLADVIELQRLDLLCVPAGGCPMYFPVDVSEAILAWLRLGEEYPLHHLIITAQERQR